MISSPSWSTHINHLNLTFNLLQWYNRKQTKLSSPVQFSQKNSVIRNLKNEIKRNNNSSFTIEQNNIITACLNRENVFFTGGAGTGKSTLLLFIIEKLYEMYEKHTVFVTATTGLAACSIGGTTVQQFAGILHYILYVYYNFIDFLFILY